jgi:glycosyltransferase involved in cell wall biosynthesis
MRIAVVTHNVLKGDGQGRANLEIVRYARKQGAEITLFADRVEPGLEDEGIRWVRIQPRIRSNWLMHGLDFMMKANALIRKEHHKFDIIHGYGASFTGRQTLNTSQFVHAAWIRNPMHPYKQSHGFYKLYQYLYSIVNIYEERIVYKNTDIIVSASSTVRKELEKYVGIPESKIRTILNGADPEEFYPGIENRSALGLPEGVPLALFAGDIRTGRKNLDSVLKALAKTPGLHLAIVGSKSGSPFPALAEQLGVAARAHFLDFRRDMPALMRACDFFVFPSRYEACALVLVEALTSGLPIITAQTTGGAEVVTDAVGMRLEDTEDIEALAAAMQALATNPERRQAMSLAARAHSVNYTWDKIASSYYSLYQEILKARQ